MRESHDIVVEVSAYLDGKAMAYELRSLVSYYVGAEFLSLLCVSKRSWGVFELGFFNGG